MKRKLINSLRLLLVAAGLCVGANAWAVEITVCNYSFDDSTHPTVSIAGSRTHADYSHTSVISSTVFLNLWGDNNNNHDATISFGSQDLSGRDWTLEFEFAGYSGCNNKVGHTYLKSGSTNLFDIEDASNWNTTFTIKYGSAQTATIPVAPCNKDTRQNAATGEALNTTTYWHHFKIEGSDAGVKLTVTNSNSGIKILDAVELSATNLNPTSIVAKPSATGAIAFDQLRLYYTTTYGEMYSEAKAPYDTKVASLDAAGQSYWTANVTSSASVTDEASYNTAVAALPTTYIAAVKAQTTAGSDMTDAMPTGNAGWTCSQGNGPASYLSTGATETYSNGSTYAKFAAGNIMTQSISDLPNGYYRVKFYGVVNAANNVSTVSGSDLVQAYANTATLDIDVIKQNSCTPTDYLRTVIAQVSDGTLTYGLKAKDGVTDAGNWAVAKIYSLTYLGSTLYDYTINYKFNDATISSTDGSAAFGETINATSPITISDTKYYATSATSMVIGEEPNVLNVTLREAETWRYTVRAVNSTAGVINDNLASGSVIEGEVGPKIFFPRYILKGTTLYCNNTGAVAYSATVTPDADDYVYDVNYNQTPVNNVAFYIEAEDVTGVTKGTNADRASMGKMGYTGGDDTYKDVTTLAPGKYILYSRCQNGNNTARDFNFKVGDKIVHTGSQAKGTNGDTTSDEFTVNTSSTLSFASEGSDQGGVDYFYLVKTAESVTVSSAGFATYVSSYDLNFTSTSIKAYKVKVSTKGKATLTEVANVPAGTPVLLYKAGGATEDIPVMTGAAAVSDNDLVAGNATTASAGVATTDGDYTNMILNNVSGIGFYYAAGQTVATNRAYLHILTTLAPDAVANSRMVMVFADETTGITSLTPSHSPKGEGSVYTLSGQRVEKPAKGLYIVNGKKVIIK